MSNVEQLNVEYRTIGYSQFEIRYSSFNIRNFIWGNFECRTEGGGISSRDPRAAAPAQRNPPSVVGALPFGICLRSWIRNTELYLIFIEGRFLAAVIISYDAKLHMFPIIVIINNKWKQIIL